MSISKNDIKKQKAGKNEKMAELESKAASGSGAAKKKLAKMKKKWLKMFYNLLFIETIEWFIKRNIESSLMLRKWGFLHGHIACFNGSEIFPERYHHCVIIWIHNHLNRRILNDTIWAYIF